MASGARALLLAMGALGLAAPAMAAGFRAVSASLAAAQESCAPANGAIDPGETNTVTFTFKNTTGGSLQGVKVALRSGINNLAFGVNGVQSAGDIARDAAFSVAFRFRADGPCGGTVSPRFIFDGREADGTPFSDVDIESTDAGKFDFQLGATITTIYTFANTNAITIQDFKPNSDRTRDNGRANPYPSMIPVAGVPNQPGRTGERVSHVAVTVYDVTHSYSADIGAVLVAPNGQKIALIRNTGGRVSPDNSGIHGITLTFDSTALANLPLANQISSGTFEPTDNGSGDLIPTQIPAGPYVSSLNVLNGPAMGVAATLADIEPFNPNGDWKLYVVDSTEGDAGMIAGGWSLQITTSKIICCGAGATYPTITPGGIPPAGITYVIEGDSGTSTRVLQVPLLSTPSNQSVTLNYATADGTARDGIDYVGTTGTVRLSPGQTTARIAVSILGNAVQQPDRDFVVNWSTTNPVSLALTQQIVRILDDDPTPSVFIRDATVTAGGSESTTMVFAAGLSAPSGQIVTASYRTLDNTAKAGVDYAAGSGILSFAPGETNTTLTVAVNSQSVNQPAKTFFVELSPPVHATLAAARATGTILSAKAPSRIRGDFNSDGHPDLIFQDADGFVAAWLLNGPALDSAQFLYPSHVGDPNYRIVGSGDFDNDGNEDLLFQHTDGTLAVWFMDGTSERKAALLQPENPGDANWQVVATGDLNQDGKTDLIFQHADGTLAVWYLDGIKLRSAALLNPASPGDRNWRVAGTGDFNADAKLDLLFQHTDGTLAVWFLDGIKLEQAALLTPSNPGDRGWRVAATWPQTAGGAIQSGKMDLVFQRTDGMLAIWFLDGIKMASAQMLSPENSGGTWRVVAPK